MNGPFSQTQLQRLIANRTVIKETREQNRTSEVFDHTSSGGGIVYPLSLSRGQGVGVNANWQ
jgi:hypothetical protein